MGDASWSPSAHRPPADMFLASVIENCRSAKMVLGIFRGPQLEHRITKGLQTELAGSAAVKGTIAIIGTSVVPDALITTTKPHLRASTEGSSDAPSGKSSGHP